MLLYRINGKNWPVYNQVYPWRQSHCSKKAPSTSEVMWQLMVLFPTGIARMAIYSVQPSHSQQVWLLTWLRWKRRA